MVVSILKGSRNSIPTKHTLYLVIPHFGASLAMAWGLEEGKVHLNRKPRGLPPICTCYWLSGREDGPGRDLGQMIGKELAGQEI